jgi:uncharacterized membrane protein YkoI
MRRNSALVAVTRGIQKEIQVAKSAIFPYLAAVSVVLLASTPAAHAFSGQALEKTARVSMAQASTVALKARPGKITDRELEREAGGSGLRYSFDIKSGRKTYEVGVDAQTGEVLENSPEGANPD